MTIIVAFIAIFLHLITALYVTSVKAPRWASERDLRSAALYHLTTTTEGETK